MVHLETDQLGGRARWAAVMAAPQALDIVREALAPFQDLGVVGATYGGDQNDNRPFAAAGIPIIRFNVDLLQGLSTWHNTQDTFDRVLKEDASQRATVTAALLWHLANRKEMLPRLPPP